ncbi:terpene synthase family protein [Kitasatospora sp. NBC_00070]|uniref:terpene synthase family protein n=1 Tax=Kitasatospora sp. NBC_00070 TaxID=2975962 RepID=UPI0038602351
MDGIRMPEVRLPFPAHEPSPHLARAQTALDAWLDESAICRSAQSRRSLERTRVPLITALAYPDAAPQALELLAQWATWTFVIDDEFDDGPDGQDPVRCAAALATFLTVLDGAPAGDFASARAFAGTWGRLVEGRSAAWRRMLGDDIRAYLWSYHQGLVDQLSGRVPTLAAYRRQRCVSAAAYTWLDVVEIAVGVDLPETVRHFSSFRDLREAAAEYVGLHNDLWSLEKDQQAGAFQNAVLLVQHHHGSSLQEAVDQVSDLITDCARRMLDAGRDLAAQLDAARITGQARTDTLDCASGYAKFVRGCFDYPSQAGRYTTAAASHSGTATAPHQLF